VGSGPQAEYYTNQSCRRFTATCTDTRYDLSNYKCEAIQGQCWVARRRDDNGNLIPLTVSKVACKFCDTTIRHSFATGSEEAARQFFLSDSSASRIKASNNSVTCLVGYHGETTESRSSIAAAGCPLGQVPVGKNAADFHHLFKQDNLTNEQKGEYRNSYFNGLSCQTCESRSAGISGLIEVYPMKEKVYSSFYDSYITLQNKGCHLYLNDGVGALECGGF
jgi:hypothetical protein